MQIADSLFDGEPLTWRLWRAVARYGLTGGFGALTVSKFKGDGSGDTESIFVSMGAARMAHPGSAGAGYMGDKTMNRIIKAAEWRKE